ncbi:MAG: TonB-dependent receptor plug domain-containing protein [Burkholderiales bacterium]|jgi:iron complex outermembrane receptor protein|nr:TonB-dependent receptor plug domain-containing protein [Burkholderiales bacterium]
MKMKTGRFLLCLGIGAVSLLNATLVLAQTPREDEAKKNEPVMEVVIVTGSSVKSHPVTPLLSRFGTQYNVVSAQAIENQNSLDFLSALREVPGVIFKSQNAVGSQAGTDLYIRGRGASHPSPDITVEFDGVPRSGVLYGQTMADGIAVGTIAGIEIYQNPQPIRFGSGYSLVNVEPKRMISEGQIANIGFSGGVYSTFSENISAGHKKGALDIYVAQDWTSSRGSRAHSRGQQESYYVNLGYALNQHWNVRLLGNYVEAQTLAPGPNEKPSADNGISWPQAERFDTAATFSTLTLNNRYRQAEGYLKAYWNDTDFDMLQELNNGERHPDGGRWSRQHLKLHGVRAKETLWLWQGGEIILGADLDQTRLTNTQRVYGTGAQRFWGFPDTTLFSPYLGMSQYFGKNDAFHLIPSVGMRYYNHNEFSDKTAAQAGLIGGYGNTDLNFNYSRGVNYPSPVVLQGLLGPGGPENPGQYWKDLTAEVVDHVELGITHRWETLGSVTATVFHDRGKNRFRAYFGGPIPTSFNDPIGRYTIRGLELTTSLRPHEGWNVFAGATWLDVKAKGSDGIERSEMPYTPSFTFKAGAQWEITESDKLYVDMQHIRGLYQGTSARSGGFNYPPQDARNKLDNITLFNLRLSRRIQQPGWRFEDMEAFLAINNLFNRPYEYVKGYPLPGITAMIGIDIKIK